MYLVVQFNFRNILQNKFFDFEAILIGKMDFKFSQNTKNFKNL